jgi:hypothetical protein
MPESEVSLKGVYTVTHFVQSTLWAQTLYTVYSEVNSIYREASTTTKFLEIFLNIYS